MQIKFYWQGYFNEVGGNSKQTIFYFDLILSHKSASMYIYLVIKPAKTLLPSYEWKKDVFGVKTKYGQYNETLKPRKETLRHHEQSHWKQIKNLIILYSNVLYMAFRKKINLNRLAKIWFNAYLNVPINTLKCTIWLTEPALYQKRL